MLRPLLFSVNIIVFTLINTIVPKNVEVTHDLPVFAVLGSEHTVTVSIDKGRIEGFAKFQVDVPPGMSITPGETQGASFTFKNGEAKFIWMSLPEENDFEMTYTLKIDDNCKVGNNDIEQRFAYLDDNERQTSEVPLHVVEIAKEDITNSAVDEGLANGTRTITKLNDDHYLIEIALYKDGIKGFAKLQENIPPGTSAEPMKKANGAFTQLDDKVKVIWFSIPEEENLEIVYELFSTDGSIDENILANGAITGAFTYLKDNETKTVDIMQGEIREAEEVVEDTSVDTSTETVTDSTSDDTTTEVIDEITDGLKTDPVVIDETAEEIIEDTTDRVTDIGTETDADIKESSAEVVDTTTGISDSTEEATDIDPSTETVTDQIDEAISETIESTTDEVIDDVEEVTPDASTTVDTTADVVVDALSDLTSTPTPDIGLVYRVQIMAGKNVVGEEYLQKRHKFTSPFDIENHEGWVKYTTGAYDIYKEARDNRVRINNNYNFDGPFVTAYNDGVRITVQEALMISRQQWYQ